ncbi:MAG: 6-phosphogluconolactonase [Limisphaerales bacterium]
MSNWELRSFNNATTMAEQCATEFLAWLISSDAPRNVALSGGRIARDFFHAVAQHAKDRNHSFAHVHFFWADERCVPPGHAESNYRSAEELLFTPLDLPSGNIHRIEGEIEPAQAARNAEAILRHLAPANADGQPVLDLILLGMGEDGHVASLFPGESENAMSSTPVYRAVTAGKPPPQRITLGYAAITAAHEAWVLASGAGKEPALKESLSSEGTTPLARVLRQREQTRIFTDLRP